MDIGRARGALWGQAVGDAVGTTQEFSRPSGRRPFPELNRSPQADLVGGGPFGLEPGQVTDDTQMAICLARSLAEHESFELEDVGQRYLEWKKYAFDIGNQTSASLSKIGQGHSAGDAGYLVWEATGRRAAGNGSLMRTSPIGVFFAHDLQQLAECSQLDSAITHADPRCQLACVAFNSAIAHALTSDAPDPGSLHAAAMTALDESPSLDARIQPDRASTARSDLLEDLRLAQRDDPELSSAAVDMHRSQGFVRVAFRLAFWELLHAPDFSSAILDVTNRGGDSDTNAAITGALYGALVGEDGVPRSWRDKVENACTGPGWEGRPFGSIYHPRGLFEILPD